MVVVWRLRGGVHCCVRHIPILILSFRVCSTYFVLRPSLLCNVHPPPSPPSIIPLPDAGCGMREEGREGGKAGGREEAALCISVTAPAASCSRHVRTPAV